MNKDINSLYEQYKSLGNPETFDEFVQLKEQAGEDMFFEFMNNYVSDSLKKKENSQEIPSSSSGLEENQPTPISAKENPQITSVPISQDLDLNQAQIEAMQGVQNPASLNLELPQQSVNQNGLLESNGEVNTSSSVLEDSFNNFIQEGSQLPLNPTSTRLNVLPRAYEEQFNNVTQTTPQVSVSENTNTTNNDFVDFGNGITLPKALLPEEKTKDEFNKEIAESAKDVTLKQSGKLETFDIENPKWISRNIGDLQGENYVSDILQKEKEGKIKVARNEKGELIDKDLKPILDNSNVLWQPIGSYINDYNNNVNEFNKEVELNNQKISQNNSLIESQNIRDLFLGKKEEPKSPLTTLYNKIYSDTGILLTEEQKAQFNTIDDVYNFYASEKAKKEVQNNPSLNYNEEYNKLINELNPKIDAQQSLQLGKNFVNNFLLGFRIEEEKSLNEARGYGAKIDPSYQKGYNSKDDLQEINFIKNLSNNDYSLGLIGEWWNAIGKKEIGTTNYKINATLSTPEGRADVINSIANYINGRGSIQKELAYENIQREKFNNLKNAKEGNTLALQNSINFIQSESNKINQIDTQQKEIYDFIDSWKKTQVRNNKKEQEFARTYSGYQSGEILPSIKIIAGNTVNGISDAVKSTIAGVAQLPNLAIGSDEYNDVISEIKKPSEFFGVKTSGMFSKYYDYKSGGKDIRFQNGNYYELVNGDYRPINLTYAQISNLGKAKEGEEFSIAGMIGDTTRMATEMALAEFTGAVALKGLSKFSQLRNIERASSVFGEESALTNSLQRLERFSKNPTNNGYFGWFTQTIADNYQEAKAKGMTNTQASVYGSVQSLLTSFLSRINPDVKFFKTYKEIDEKLIGSLLKNDKQGFLNNLKSLSNHVGGEISSETGQELTERFAQELVKQFYNTSLTDKKFDTMTADDVLKTVITTTITTGALTSSNLTLRGSGDNIINYDNAYYNSTQLSEGQKLVMLANLNTSEIFKNFNNQFISDKNKLNEIEQTVKSVKTYLDKIPNKDKYTLNTQTKAVSLLYEIDQKRKQLNNVDESFKDDINNEINDLTDNLKQLLNDDLKLQNEQPQQTTQPEQTQETAQGQTTETTLQSEQGTVAGEQGVSIDLNAKNGDTLYKQTDNTNQNIQDNGKKDTRTTVQEQGSGEKMLGNEQRSQENGQNTDLGLSSMGEQNQEQRQTTQQVEEVATNITEEEQVKINLERLNAYIEAKKQREQEQQVQVSPSEEAENVQQNEAFSVNEQPQTIEQPSETQTTPLVSESKSTNGKYTIRVEQNNGIGTANILDNNGNEVKLTNKQKEKYVAEHFAKQAYPETVVEDADKLKPSEFNQEIINTSNNPLELAQILDTESEFIPSDLLDAKENAIANVIGKKVSRSSFIQFDDANNISFSIARGYGLTNKGKTIDVIAQEAEVLIYGDWDSQNPRVTTEDVINFMKKYNNGADTFFRQPNPTYRDAAGKFEKITGIKATKNALDVLLGKKTATKIDFAKLQKEADILSAEQAYNLEKEYNEWFNSLSLEDKNLELQKTYPYEQRTEENTNQSQNESIPNDQTESSKNVANQERDGATTEEINQVSPSPQYEGAVTYTQFGEGQEGTLYYEDGVAKIKDKAGKVYNANSPLVKNLKDAEGNAIQLQKGNQRLTPITKQAFDALVTKLQKAFPRFAKVTTDLEQAKQRAVELGENITDLEFKTSNGNVYGFKLSDGTIYLNPEFLNANTPIHEFSHLFEQLLPSRFKKGVELLKQTNLGNKLFEQLKQEGNYANLTDEQLWGEALNTHIGNFGENEANNTKGKLKQLQDWIKDFFAKVGDVLGIKKLSPDTQLRMFTEGVVKDLLGGKPIVAENQVSPSEQVQYSFLTENDYDTNGNIKPEVLAEIQAEREAIKSEAQANGTFMKAPNGKATNLNEAQWIDVRTKRFKDWFGDWENDAKNASKVVDKNGEPLVVYHGTNQNFNEFSQEKLGINTGTVSSRAFFFTEDQEEATEYAFLAAKKLISNEDLINEKSEKILKQIEIAERKGNWDLAEKLYLELEENELGAINEGDTTGASVYPIFLNIRNSNNYDFEERVDLGKISELIDDKRFDGLQLFNVFDPVGYRPNSQSTKQWVAYNPNQIKSATANVGTYSASNNDIRFSINSTTPLSVKEQTEIINDLVANGEDSAFAKLQETNWYKELSDNQKQNITPTNIAETVVNAVNFNKRNLEQKVERRDAKIEKLQDKNKSELEKHKKYYVDKINDIKQKYKDALTELNIKNKTAVEKVRERLDLKKSAINQIKQLLSNKEVGKNVTPSEVMSLVRMSELFFSARDLDKAFDKFIIRFEKVFDKAQYRNKSAEEKFNDKLSKVSPLTADEKASYRRETKSLKERMLTFKNKWFANQGGIIKPFLEHRDRATGLANWEKRVAKNTVEQLTDEANKIGFNTESNWEIFNNALQGDETAIDRLPETIKPYVTMMRSQIDGLSLELIKNDLVTKEQALAIEENLGKYITRGYSIFEGDTTIEKVGKKFFRMIFKKENSIASRFDSEKWADAVTVFQQNVLNEIVLDSSGKYDKYDTDEKKQSFARGEGERRLLEYLSELESEYKRAGSGVGADTSVLERRKEIAEPIRRLLGEYIDPRMSFLLTVSRVSDLAYQRKFLSQVKEIGLGTFLFEEGDPNIPIEGYVKIASDTNGAYSPLNGLYTTKEFKDVFLGEPQKEKYEIEKLWLKLTGLVKVGKTVFSPLTQAVNFNANFGFLINNGLILDVKQISPAFKAFSDSISNGRLDNYIVRELIEENILGQSLIFNEVEKDFGINMEKELIKSIRQTTAVKTAKEIADIPFRLYKASDDFFKAFAYFSEADRYAKAYFGKKYEELTGDDRMKIRKIASEVVKNTMPNYDRVYRAANFPKEFTRNAVGNYLSFQAESIRTKINSIQYAIADLKNEKTRLVGAKRLAGIMTYNSIYGTVTTLVGKAAGMGMAGLLGFFDDEDEDEKRANFNLTVPEWARSVEKYYRREKDGTITWFAYGNANPYGIWYKTANAYFNGSSNTKGGLISVFDELLTPFLGTEMSLKWISNTFIAEKNDYGIPLVTPKDKLDYSIEKLSPSIVKLIKDNTDNRKENDFELVNVLGIKKYNFNPTDQLRYKYNDYAALMSDLGSKKYALEKQVESGKKKPEEVMDKWQDYDEKQKEYADEFRELAKAYISLGADPTFIQGKATKKFKYEINSISDWWDYITRPE